MKFSFVGNLEFNMKEDAKVPAIREVGETGLGINAAVASSKNNRAYIEAVGWKNDVIKTKDTEKNNIEIKWKDRKDRDVVKQVANYMKNVIADDDDRHEFISTYDFCSYIQDNLEDLVGKRCLVTGRTQENFWKGKESKRFQINNIYLIDEDDERKNKLELNTILYFNKDSIDTEDFKDEKKIYINGYTEEFIAKNDLNEDQGGDRYVPIQVVLDCSRIDFENEKHVKKLQYNLMNLGLAYKDGKIANSLKSSKYYANEVVLTYYNGAKDMGDASEITYDMLTDMQKMKVDLGMAKPEDFAAKGKVFGDRIVEYRISTFPNTNGTYEDGFVEVEDTVSEFKDKIFIPAETDDDPPFDENDEDEDDLDMPKPKKSKKTEEDEDEKPKKKATKKKPEPEPEADDDDDDDEEEEEEVKPKKKAAKKKSEPEEEEEEEEDDDDLNDLFG